MLGSFFNEIERGKTLPYPSLEKQGTLEGRLKDDLCTEKISTILQIFEI